MKKQLFVQLNNMALQLNALLLLQVKDPVAWLSTFADQRLSPYFCWHGGRSIPVEKSPHSIADEGFSFCLRYV